MFLREEGPVIVPKSEKGSNEGGDGSHAFSIRGQERELGNRKKKLPAIARMGKEKTGVSKTKKGGKIKDICEGTYFQGKVEGGVTSDRKLKG